MLFTKRKNKRFGIYPCNDYLNNTLRLLLQEEPTDNVVHAISEIIHCVHEANGHFVRDVKKTLKERGYI